MLHLSAPHSEGCTQEWAVCTPSNRQQCTNQTSALGQTCLKTEESIQIYYKLKNRLQLQAIHHNYIYDLPFMPPENPLQLANTMRGSCSRLKSLIAWAVL